GILRRVLLEMSHNSTAPSSPPLASNFPSGLNANDPASEDSPTRDPTWAPLAISQSLIVFHCGPGASDVTLFPLASSFPSGLNAIVLAHTELPPSDLRRVPLSISHS